MVNKTKLWHAIFQNFTFTISSLEIKKGSELYCVAKIINQVPIWGLFLFNEVAN